jgi:hypothetical protein
MRTATYSSADRQPDNITYNLTHPGSIGKTFRGANATCMWSR